MELYTPEDDVTDNNNQIILLYKGLNDIETAKSFALAYLKEAGLYIHLCDICAKQFCDKRCDSDISKCDNYVKKLQDLDYNVFHNDYKEFNIKK